MTLFITKRLSKLELPSNDCLASELGLLLLLFLLEFKLGHGMCVDEWHLNGLALTFKPELVELLLVLVVVLFFFLFFATIALFARLDFSSGLAFSVFISGPSYLRSLRISRMVKGGSYTLVK